MRCRGSTSTTRRTHVEASVGEPRHSIEHRRFCFGFRVLALFIFMDDENIENPHVSVFLFLLKVGHRIFNLRDFVLDYGTEYAEGKHSVRFRFP